MTKTRISGLRVIAADSSSLIAWRYLNFMYMTRACRSSGVLGPICTSSCEINNLSAGNSILVGDDIFGVFHVCPSRIFLKYALHETLMKCLPWLISRPVCVLGTL